jgi:hypothetical protein
VGPQGGRRGEAGARRCNEEPDARSGRLGNRAPARTTITTMVHSSLPMRRTTNVSMTVRRDVLETHLDWLAGVRAGALVQ